MAAAGEGRRADWYFDFISPFSYFQLQMFDRLPAGLSVTLKPVLFAGLLGHWGQKGPAEIPGKRLHTYRHCQWYADRHGIPFRMPPAHPFNPLGPLRLAAALDATPEAVGAIFAAIWAEGVDVASEAGWARLAERVGLSAAEAQRRAGEQAVKDRLRDNTGEAADRGVFGVPSFVCDGEVFWGVDSTDMFLDYLADPALFDTGEMARIAGLPIGQARKL
jgi:2-hydroxychromene-2-carboxylate isomerase